MRDMASEPRDSAAGRVILTRLLDRLFAAILSGPSLNCRPHHSRQRIDLMQILRLQDVQPVDVLRDLLSDAAKSRVAARVPQPPAGLLARTRRTRRPFGPSAAEETPPESEASLTDSQRAALRDWTDQQQVLSKLRIIAEEARTYENDTGVNALYLGFPLLALPPGSTGGASRRVLAPLALIPLRMKLTQAGTPMVELECRADDVDRVHPNTALLSWLEQQTGKTIPELFADEQGRKPWREVREIVAQVGSLLDIALPAAFTAPPAPAAQEENAGGEDGAPPADANQMPADFAIQLCPRTDELPDHPAIIASAVLGLFPLANQGLIRDTRAMIVEGPPPGPVQPFLQAASQLDAHDGDGMRPSSGRVSKAARQPRVFDDERLIAAADPCQARAVRLARECPALVVHGPPGTGKSQTITNVIGDHLARGERVLFVCDKRTALDVVANRLRALGLGDLCAVVHDPQLDQRDLYRQLREQLERLTEVSASGRAESKLAKLDAEIAKLHSDLQTAYDDLMSSADGDESFHTLVGRWCQASAEAPPALLESLKTPVELDELDREATRLQDVFGRVARLQWWQSPWRDAATADLPAFLRDPAHEHRRRLDALRDAAAALDQTCPPEGAPPCSFSGRERLQSEAAERTALADQLTDVLTSVPADVRASWLQRHGMGVRTANQALQSVATQVEAIRSAPLDPELQLALAGRQPQPAGIAGQIASLDEYLAGAGKWTAFLQFGARKRATNVLSAFGLPLGVDAAQRARAFLTGLRARLLLQQRCDEAFGRAPAALPAPDSMLLSEFEQVSRLLALLARIEEDASLAPIAPALRAALRPGEEDTGRALAAALRTAPQRAAKMEAFAAALDGATFLHRAFSARLLAAALRGERVAPSIEPLAAAADAMEDAVRAAGAIAGLPAALQSAVTAVISTPASESEYLAALRTSALRGAIDRRLRANPRLTLLDGSLIETQLSRYSDLQDQKRNAVIAYIRQRWTARQVQRLVAGTGSRLNSDGADLRRRLTLRGANALRLRQVIAAGARYGDEGDPLFDLAPVWLASPERVAQVFPRKPMFDIVMFDEASQVRLEEALPVLTRGRRVFIAGDPKQLPPTRFFESALSESAVEEVETEQDLFEAHQSSVDDLLDAALGLDLPQSYLDVHYRSQSSDLIEFSNQSFYQGRLQPLPGHPDAAPAAALHLHAVNGVYEDRRNEAEAAKIVELVAQLLSEKKPPTIGIACFNIVQRDLIVERLEEAAAEDEKFARRLAEARERTDDGAFVGLFVKNLENVQGDERDVMLISTTYGPDPNGRFYRRFGPLGQPGGGRRLNVLLTRAKRAIHVVTSIPRNLYQNLPPIPAGQTASGGWLLLAYLRFVEQLASNAGGDGAPGDAAAGSSAALVREILGPVAAHHPSAFAAQFARQLETRGLVARPHWGNDGFCIDVAARVADATRGTVGVICDFNRYDAADEPVDWEAFRIGMFRQLGWQLHRLWTPAYLRDPDGALERVRKAAMANGSAS
jgi:hypothetical protein